MKSPDLSINPRFRDLIPALTTEEYEQLEANCLADGILDPIKVWSSGSIILDGHNRYKIAKEHGLDFKVHSLAFSSNEEAMNWIDENQLGRRNLDPDMMALLRGRIYNRTKQAHGDASRTAPIRHFGGLGETAPALASKMGVSPRTLERDGAYAEAVEKLDLAQEVTGKTLDAPRARVIEAAKALPENPTPKQVETAKAAIHAPRPKPAPAPTPKPGPEGTDVEALHARIRLLEAEVELKQQAIDNLKEDLAETAKLLRDTEEENQSMGRVVEADDQVKAAMAEAKRFRELARVVEERNRGLQNQNHALSGEAKRWMNKFLRLEKKAKGDLATDETFGQVGA